MKYKLLALDVDDTIVPNGTNDLSPKVKKALQDVSKKIHVSLVTARAKSNFENILNLLELPPEYHVYENGAKIIDPHGEIVRDLHIPDVEVQKILNVTSKYFDEVGFCIDDHWNDDGQENVDTQHGVTGLSFTVKKDKYIPIIEKKLRDLPKKYSVYTGRHWLSPEWTGILLFHANAQKGIGMHYIQTQLGIFADETIAVGDGATDLSMFEYSAVKVAVENAEEQVKEKANYIAPSVHEEGIIDVINKYIHGSE